MSIPYAKHEITNDDIDAVIKALKSGYLTGGSSITEFEDSFKNHVGSNYSVAVSSGTAGLHLAVAALGIDQNKTVLMPSLTFAATANCVLYCGGKVEFVDIDPKTYLIDLDLVEAKLKSNPEKYAGVIAVDFAGYPIDIKELSKICKKYGVWLIEDAAHALGAVSNRGNTPAKVGSSKFSDATVFSFHPVKHITTGEGGMITSNNQNVAHKISLLRSHAMNKDDPRSKTEGWYYSIKELGYNYRISDINAALGTSQLLRADMNLVKRQRVASIYNSRLSGLNLKLPYSNRLDSHAYHLYVIQSSSRHDLYNKLRDKGIYTQVHYLPLHMQEYYKNFDGVDSLQNTKEYYASSLSIPMYPSLTDRELEYVIKSIVESV